MSSKLSVKTEDIKVNYRNINHSFRRRLSFGIGLHAGFFSEVNLMVLAVIYCLHHKIRFLLHSENANFRLKKGWQDYFEPFCDETTDPLLRELDRRYKTQYGFTFTKPKRMLRYVGYEWKIRTLKRKLKVDYLTFDLLDEILNRQLEHISYDVPELGIKGDLRHACHVIANMLWEFTPETRALVDVDTAALQLPAEYIGFQIRRGDKHQEIPFIDIDTYLEKAQEISSIRNAFVLTDDYGVIDELRTKYPAWHFYTLCKPEEQGYSHVGFFAKTADEIYRETVKLITNIEILRKSALFVGTFSANPSMFLGMIMEREKAVSVDVDWQIWYGKPL